MVLMCNPEPVCVCECVYFWEEGSKQDRFQRSMVCGEEVWHKGSTNGRLVIRHQYGRFIKNCESSVWEVGHESSFYGAHNA